MGGMQVVPADAEQADVEKDVDYVAEAFRDEGYLSRALPGYEPRVGQVEMAYEAASAMEAGHNLLCEAPTGCHAKGQGILLYDGSVKLAEDVLVGDLLMGPDGTPRRVQSLARGRQATVDIVPVKGKSWRVNAGHVLTLVHTQTAEVVDVSVKEWKRWNKTNKHVYKLFRVGCEFGTDHELPIHPYHLGMLLGDGHFGESISVCKADLEIEKECGLLAKSFGLRLRTQYCGEGRVTHYLARKERYGSARNNLKLLLKSLGLEFTRACDKFVPYAFKTSTWEERAELLAGLLDTDGSLVNGGYDYVSKSQELADDVAFVARSLGLAAYVKPCIKRWQSGVGEYFRVSISGDCSELPLRIPRKKAPARRQKKSVLRTGFRVRPTGKIENYYGFSLSGDGRYLLDDFTVTHNTGKSAAYGVPATWHASRGEKVVIVTANISLQEQIIKKDLPVLERALPWRFTYALAKGIGNFVCLAKFDESMGDVLDQGTIEGTDRDRERWREIVGWIGKTTTGDLSELDFVPEHRLLEKFTTTADECIGRKCKRFDDCHAQRAKTKVRSAQLVVTNYALFFIDMVLKQLGADGVLPVYKHVVMDESHRAPDAARSHLGFSVSKWSVARAVRLLDQPADESHPKGYLPRISGTLKRQAVKAADAMFAALHSHMRSRRYSVRFRRAWDDELLGRARDFEQAMKDCSAALLEAAADSTLSEARRFELGRAAPRCTLMASQVIVAATCDGEGWVYHLEEAGQTVVLKGTPVSVARFLAKGVFERREGPDAIKSCVVTSATLATSEGDYEYVKRELGLVNAVETAVESPFDVAANMLIVAPPMPSPKAEQRFEQAVADRMLEVVERSQGRALCLFTSHRMLNKTYERMKGKVGYRLLRQGEMPRVKLIEEFRRDVHSVLLGTDSFWAGVDVPGESCSVVAIDRLPFPNISDPVQDWLKEKQGDKYFMRTSVPAAVITFRQGGGRLLRTVWDRGCVVVLDSRMVGKGYGRKFVRAFPTATRVTKDIDEIQAFLMEPRGSMTR